MFEQAWKYLTEYQAVRIISLDNSLVHQGKGFLHHNYHSVANGANLDHLIVTPPNIDVHFRSWNVKSNEGPVYITAYEGTTVSSNGTAEAVGNNNRQSVITPQTSIYLTPTVTAVGNPLLTDFIGTTGGGAHVAVGESAESNTEWLLKRGTKYLFRVLNSSGVTTNISVIFGWYEI